MRPLSFILITVAFFAIVAAGAALAGGISWAVPVVLVAVVVGAYALANRDCSDVSLSEHGGDEDAALRDAGDGGLPKAHLIGDDRTALGDSPSSTPRSARTTSPRAPPNATRPSARPRRRTAPTTTTTRGRPIRASAGSPPSAVAHSHRYS